MQSLTDLQDKPPAPGPYYEVHNTANFTIPSFDVSLYIQYDGTTVTSVCDGKASMFNFTAVSLPSHLYSQSYPRAFNSSLELDETF